MRPRRIRRTWTGHFGGASWPSRLAVGLLLALLVPTAAMVLLAVQSLRSETVARKHRLEQTHRQIAAIVAAQIDAQIEELNRSIALEITTAGSVEPVSESSLIERLRRAQEHNRWLTPAALLRADGGIVYPRRALPPGGGPVLSALVIDRESEFGGLRAGAEAAELRDEPARAATLYASAVKAATSGRQIVGALNGLARCELKAGRHDRALDAYARLIATASHVDPQQADLAAVAHHQRIICFEAVDDGEGAAQAAVDLFEYLLAQRFVVDPDLYELYRRELEPRLASLNATGAPAPNLDRLRGRERELDDVARRLEAFSETLPRLPLHSLAENAAASVVRMVAIPGAEDRVVSLVNLGPATSSAAGATDSLGNDRAAAPGPVLLAYEWTAAEVTELIASLAQEPGPWQEVGIALVGPGGVLSSTVADPTPEDLAAAGAALTTLPGWSVAAFSPAGSIDAVAARGMWRQGTLLGFVALTVVAALLLAGWSVSRELALSRLRSEFVSSVSHELRTPLALIQMFAESLEEGWIDEKDHTSTYRKIRRETERLTSLIDNVLSFAKIEAGTRQLEFEETDLGDLVNGVIARYGQQLAAAEVSLEWDIPASPIIADVDPEAMSQVLGNLLSNAIKYIGEGDKRVRIAVFTDGEHCGFSVRDSGIGMEAAAIERIYERYYRVEDERVRSTPGSGIGLTVVASIVEAHGGSISVHSDPGAGSEFTVSVPVVQERSS